MVRTASEFYDAVRGGDVIPTQTELLEAAALIESERRWMRGLRRYATNHDILEAANSGKLVEVTETADFRPLPSITNPIPQRQSLPFLLPEAKVALVNFSRQWREVATDSGVAETVKLSVSSIARSTDSQADLIRRGKLAVEDSSHERAAAWDIPAADYYIVDETGITSVSLRPPESALPFERFYLEQGAPPVPTRRLGPEHFDPRVPAALKQVAGRWHELGLVNAVDEFGQTRPDNEVIHFGINIRAFHTQ